MSKPVFGRDFLPPKAAPRRSDCGPGGHLVDDGLQRCTECGWLDPSVIRCDVIGCVRPAEYEAQIGPRAEGPQFTTVIVSGRFCFVHVITGGISLVPTEGRPA